MIAKSFAAALATSVTLAFTALPAEANHRRSGANVDFNVVIGGYAFPYGRFVRPYGPGVVINPFIHPDGRIHLNYLRRGHLFATDYIGFVDYGRHGRVRGFYTFDGGYYDNRGRYHPNYGHSYRRYSYENSYRRGYHYCNGDYDRNGRHYRRYDDDYFGRPDDWDRRHHGGDDCNDQRDERDFRNEPYRNGVPPGGIRSQEYPGGTNSQRIPYSDDIDDRLDG